MQSDASENNQIQPLAPRRRSNPFARITLVLALIAFPIILCALAIATPGPLMDSKTIVVPRGMKISEIADLLDNNGIIWHPIAFRVAAKMLAEDTLQAGEYLFTPRESIAEAIQEMREGRSVIRRFTVAEGLTSHEIVDLLNNELSLSGEIKDIPEEGTLLPETYHYNYGDNRSNIIDRMQRKMKDTLSDLWSKRSAYVILGTPQEALIMASVIEKETGKKAAERARVAGVFYNRLTQNMRLQSDPTVIYAITQGQGALPRSLTHNDLATPSPYNTYVNGGLPPKPICNPGRAAIEAALQPELHDYIYFVADGTGGHAFTRNLSDHNQQVGKWNKIIGKNKDKDKNKSAEKSKDKSKKKVAK